MSIHALSVRGINLESGELGEHIGCQMGSTTRSLLKGDIIIIITQNNSWRDNASWLGLKAHYLGNE